jgi:hypothetical protein
MTENRYNTTGGSGKRSLPMVCRCAIGKALGLAAATQTDTGCDSRACSASGVHAQKTIATVIILAGSVLVAAVFRDIAFPAILCMLGLLGLQRRFTWNLPPERRVVTSLLLLLLAILFAAHYTYGGLAGRAAHDQAAIVAWGTIARYFLASMTLILFLGSPQRLPPSLALFYMATVVSAGQVLLFNDLYMAFRLLEALSVVLIVLYAATGSGWPARAVESATPRRSVNLRQLWRRCPPRWVASGLILLLAINLGWITSSILYRHVELLNYVPVWLWRSGVGIEGGIDATGSVGFTTSGELSSLLKIKGEGDTTPVLRIVSDTNPGYLRARAFDVYRQSKWTDLSAMRAVFPSQNTPFGGYLVGRMSLFRLSNRTDLPTQEMMIRHESSIRDAMFTPLGAVAVEAPLSMLLSDDDGIVVSPGWRLSLNYRVTYTDSIYAPRPTRSLLDVPPQLDPRVKVLSEKIFTGSTTTAEKIDAVVNHFRTNYTYSLGIDIPRGRDKLEYFLLEGSSGYCEYFASGAAILLRLAGVPTRYITGFLVTERDPGGNAWIARNMDAHAWVEAWDEGNNQWKIVEATVQEGLGTASEDEESKGPGGLSRFILLSQLVNDLYEYGLFGVLAWALQYYGLYAVSFLLATALAGTSWWLYRRAKARRTARTARPLTPELIALHKLLARMDRRVKTAGPRRDLNETLQAFSHRLRAQDSGDGLWTRVSDWYLEYANLRYSRTISGDRLQHLQHLANLLQQP